MLFRIVEHGGRGRRNERRLPYRVAEALEPRRLLAATYYISPTGNDANSGRSPAQAWQTLDRINQKNWNPGDRILLEGGKHFAVHGSPSANLLANGGFEADLSSGWSDTYGTDPANSVITSDPSFVHSGAGALAIGTGTAARGQDVTSQVRANHTYELSFWSLRTTKGFGTCEVGITFYTANNTKLGTFYQGIRNGRWSEAQFSFVVPIGFARAEVFAAKSSDLSTLYVDDVSLRSLPNGIVLDANDSGSAKYPVIISTYGRKKPAKISAGNGTGISLVNASNIVVTNLMIVGTWNALTGEGPSSGVGIDVVNTLPGDVKLSNITIGAVESKGFRWGGIRVWGNNGKSGYSNVDITKNRVRWNGDAGIIVSGAFDATSTAYSNSKIYVTYNRVSNNTGIIDKGTNTGSGIEIVDVDGALVQGNIVYQNGQFQDNSDGGPVGIWAFDSNAVTMQYNESFENHASATSAKDGGGLDLDGGVTNSVMQYNYSHDNDGPGFLAVQFAGFRPSGHNVIRYNITQNDARCFGYGGITLSGNSDLKDVLIEHNTVYVDPSPYTNTSALRLIGIGTGVQIRNNIFVTTGNAYLVNGIPGSSIAQINGNDFFSSGATPSYVWENQFYTSLDAWRAVGPEMLNGSPTGTDADPQLLAPGTAGMLLNAKLLKKLSEYELAPTSPMINAAITIPDPGSGYVPATYDFFGNRVPLSGAADIGAAERA